jgi:hypothetical protein
MRRIILLLWLLLAISPLKAQESYFVRTIVDNPTPFVGEQVVYTVHFYAETVPDHEYFEPDFEGWWRGEQIISTRAELVDGRQYAVVVYETLLYPLQPGELVIDAARIVVPETVFSDRVELLSEPIIVQVKLLTPDAPSNFTGAVGRFDAEVTLSQQTIILGEPLTLRYMVNGSGNVSQLAAPSLQLPQDWRAYPNPAMTTLQTRGVGERIFEWRLIPETAGSHKFPQNEFVYFDPQAGEYRVIALPGFTIDVLPSSDGQRELPTFRRNATAPAALAIKPQLMGNSQTHFPLWIWGVPPLVAALIWGMLRFQRWNALRYAEQRRLQALSVAKKRLQAARRQGGAETYLKIQEAIQRYFADKKNVDDRKLSPAEIHTILHQLDVDNGVLHALMTAEEGRYAPAGTVDVNQLVIQTIDALTVVDKNWAT